MTDDRMGDRVYGWEHAVSMGYLGSMVGVCREEERRIVCLNLDLGRLEGLGGKRDDQKIRCV